MSRFLFNTGNVFDLEIFNKNIISGPNDEFFEALHQVVKDSDVKTGLVNDIQLQSNTVTCLSSDVNIFRGHERSELKFTVKLFLYPDEQSSTTEEECVQYTRQVRAEALETIEKLLKTSKIDQLILSVQTANSALMMNNLQALWNDCAEYDRNKVGSLATSDLTYEQLKQIFDCSAVKPVANYINMEGCCEVPADIDAFTKQKNIPLITHNDPQSDFIPIDRLRLELDSVKNAHPNCSFLSKVNSASVRRNWIVRYLVRNEEQGVILTKGYICSFM